MPRGQYRNDEILTAFGQEQTRFEWAHDPRLSCRINTFYWRLDRGWPCEAAVALNATDARRFYNAFGDRKSFLVWLADERCAVSASVLKQRIDSGEGMETALMRPEEGSDSEEFDSRNGKYLRNYDHRHLHWAFGEKKTLRMWSADSRCRISLTLLKHRVTESHLPVEAAMIYLDNELTAKLRWAFGERKRLSEWLVDPRLTVSQSEFRERLLGGEPVESALTRPMTQAPPSPKEPNPTRAKRQIKMLGETKPLAWWAKDPRCEVSAARLRERIEEGHPLDERILKLTGPETPFAQQFIAFLPEIGRYRTLDQAKQAIEKAGGSGAVLNIVSGALMRLPEDTKMPTTRRSARRRQKAN